MNLKEQMIVEAYRLQRPDFVRLEDVVLGLIRDNLEQAGITTMAVEHRIKTESSLLGKLARKSDKYNRLEDLTDILGLRVICFFSDDVDRTGRLIETLLRVDWENSVDKRALIRADSFGYLSLHYICSLPDREEYPAELREKKFEIQVRSALQHTWAYIEHDMGYKSQFGTPRVAVRQFARIAGLLELADEEFVRVRDTVRDYTEEIRRKIMDDEADEVLLDMVSLQEYLLRNRKMRRFLEELASLCGAEIREISAEPYMEQLRWLGKRTLGDLELLLAENRALAMKLARNALEHSELDILSSTVGLRYLCRAELLNRDYTEEQVTDFLTLSTGNPDRARRMAKSLLRSGEAEKERTTAS